MQLGQNVLVGMVAIEAHQNALLSSRLSSHMLGDLRCDAGTLDHRDALEERVRLDRLAGKAGKLLRSTLNEFGFRRENTLISNVLPCRPQDNTFPTDRALVEDCVRMWLKEEIRLAGPQILLLVGAKSLKFVAGLDGITRVRGQWLVVDGISCLACFHPSFVLRKSSMPEGPEVMRLFRDDIRTVAARAGFIPGQA